MNRISHTTGLTFLSALLLSACTQQAVDVVNKGNQFFGKDGAMMAAHQPAPAARPAVTPEYNAPTYEETASLDSITSTTLDAPESVAVSSLPPLQEQTPAVVTNTASYVPQDAPFERARPAAAPASDLTTAALAPLEISPQVNSATPVTTPLPQTVAELQQADELQSTSVMETTSAQKFIWPVEGKVISGFGPKKNGLVNDGINISASEGEPIWAASEGEVVYSGNELKGYGNMIIVRHAEGWMTAYAHASDVLVTKGDKIAQGDLIGYVGSTGSVNAPQLHFGIREGKTPVNPEQFLPRRVASAN